MLYASRGFLFYKCKEFGARICLRPASRNHMGNMHTPMLAHSQGPLPFKAMELRLYSSPIPTIRVLYSVGNQCSLCAWHTHKGHVKVVVRKQKMKTENRKQRIRRFNGSLETRTVRGRERECVREKNRKFYSKNSSIYNNLLYMCVCSMHTFIQVLTRTDRSTIVLQCS